jgi:molybdate transport system substrate-binding protein
MMRFPHDTKVALAVSLLLLLGTAPSRGASDASKTLNVFAAASLSDAFSELGHMLEQRQPGVRVRFNFAGSQQLVAQLEQGAAADVFASADERWMSYAKDHGLVSGEPSMFVRNRLVVIVPKPNPARISRLEDLAKGGIKLVLAADAVPVGHYSRVVLKNLSRTEGFAPDFAPRVMKNVVSEEDNVKSVVTKVQLGEADAGIVYRSDISPAVARYVRVFEIPEAANVIATYPIAMLKASPDSDAAKAFIDLVLSADGQRVLEQRGLMPIAANSP